MHAWQNLGYGDISKPRTQGEFPSFPDTGQEVSIGVRDFSEWLRVTISGLFLSISVDKIRPRYADQETQWYSVMGVLCRTERIKEGF